MTGRRSAYPAVVRVVRVVLVVGGWLAALAGANLTMAPVESAQRPCGRAYELALLGRDPTDLDHPVRTAAEQLSACRHEAFLSTGVGCTLLALAGVLLFLVSRTRRRPDPGVGDPRAGMSRTFVCLTATALVLAFAVLTFAPASVTVDSFTRACEPPPTGLTNRGPGMPMNEARVSVTARADCVAQTRERTALLLLSMAGATAVLTTVSSRRRLVDDALPDPDPSHRVSLTG